MTEPEPKEREGESELIPTLENVSGRDQTPQARSVIRFWQRKSLKLYRFFDGWMNRRLGEGH